MAVRLGSTAGMRAMPAFCGAASTGNTKLVVPRSHLDGAKSLTKNEGASTDFRVISERLSRLTLPYWQDDVVGAQARWRLAGLLALTLGTTGVSVIFNFLGRDFFNAISEKDAEAFTVQLVRYLGGFALGIPVYVFRSYFQSRLATSWRQWLTSSLLQQYFDDRTFYQLQVSSSVDNPDQRIASDVRTFTDTALALSVTLLNAAVDLVSFSGILFTIYPPLFAVLIAYAAAGTAVSVVLGRNLVTLNFNQEAREADFRYNLVRVRENAESVAFYGGESAELRGLLKRLEAAVANYFELITASRNLDFFTSFYRYLIMLLPAAVVAPLYFKGEIEFGVITQSQSAFSHILGDVSLVVYQVEALAGFSAVVDRLGEFQEEINAPPAATLAAATPALAAGPTASGGNGTSSGAEASPAAASSSNGVGSSGAAADAGAESGAIRLQDAPYDPSTGVLLRLDNLALWTPTRSLTLVESLTLDVSAGRSLLIMGPSGAGKTSLLRATAGLWLSGRGSITRFGNGSMGQGEGAQQGGGYGDVFFLPQRPYVVLGTLRDQLLYPVWSQAIGSSEATTATTTSSSSDATASASATTTSGSGSSSSSSSNGSHGSNGVRAEASGSGSSSSNISSSSSSGSGGKPMPTDEELEDMLERVRLGSLLERLGGRGSGALDTVTDWASRLSLGEQQRLAFARLLLARPLLALMDESTSALDEVNEDHLYQEVRAAGITVVSVGHRSSLKRHHQQVLNLVPASTEGAGSTSTAGTSWTVAAVVDTVAT